MNVAFLKSIGSYFANVNEFLPTLRAIYSLGECKIQLTNMATRLLVRGLWLHLLGDLQDLHGEANFFRLTLACPAFVGLQKDVMLNGDMSVLQRNLL